MSNAVLLSIRPRWCGLIASGKKTIEVRKTRPKIDAPFKCYIYQTATGKKDWQHPDVIGEFVCDRILTVDCDSVAPFDKETGDYINELCCLGRNELWEYTHGRCAYGWHISDLKIYDEPREIGEFVRPCVDKYHYCEACKHAFIKYPAWVETAEDLKGCCFDTECLNTVKRPPQSWCYVEEWT